MKAITIEQAKKEKEEKGIVNYFNFERICKETNILILNKMYCPNKPCRHPSCNC